MRSNQELASQQEFWASEIVREAKKLIVRHQTYAWNLDQDFQRRERRGSTSLPSKKVLQPKYWEHKAFDPYYVWKNAPKVAFAIARSLRQGSWKPQPAVKYDVAKSDGDFREVSVFPVADNAVSRVVFKRLTEKNAPRLSARCYAYRDDIGIHDAVYYVSSKFRSHERVYIAEFDFAKFFDSITHEHILEILESGRFVVSREDKLVLEGFLKAPSLTLDDYRKDTEEIRERGIPQGTSVSLFLANLAAFEPRDPRCGILPLRRRYSDLV